MPCIRLFQSSCQLGARRSARPTWKIPSRLDRKPCSASKFSRSPTSNFSQSEEGRPPRAVSRVARVEKEELNFRASEDSYWTEESGGNPRQGPEGEEAFQGRQGRESVRQKYSGRASRQPSWNGDSGRQTTQGGGRRGGPAQRRGDTRGGGRQRRGGSRQESEAPWQSNGWEASRNAELQDTGQQKRQPGFQVRNPRRQSGQVPSQEDASNWWSSQQNGTPYGASNQGGYRGRRRSEGRYSPRDSPGRGAGESSSQPWQGYNPRTDARQAAGQQRRVGGTQNPAVDSTQGFDESWDLWEEAGEGDVSEEIQEAVNQRRRQSGGEAGTRESTREPAQEGGAWGRRAQGRPASSGAWQAAVCHLSVTMATDLSDIRVSF
jgi:hypothetical protein